MKKRNYPKDNSRGISRAIVNEPVVDSYMIPKESGNHIGIKETVLELCEKYHVEKLYLFGSVAEGKVNETSDMDLLVKFKEVELKDYFDNYIHLKHQLETLFQRKVDLMELQTLKNPILIRSIERNKKLIYG